MSMQMDGRQLNDIQVILQHAATTVKQAVAGAAAAAAACVNSPHRFELGGCVCASECMQPVGAWGANKRQAAAQQGTGAAAAARRGAPVRLETANTACS